MINTNIAFLEQFRICSNPRNRDKIDNPNTHIHDQSLSFLGTDNSIKSGEIKLVLYPKPPLREMMRSRKRFPPVSKISILTMTKKHMNYLCNKYSSNRTCIA